MSGEGAVNASEAACATALHLCARRSGNYFAGVSVRARDRRSFYPAGGRLAPARASKTPDDKTTDARMACTACTRRTGIDALGWAANANFMRHYRRTAAAQ